MFNLYNEKPKDYTLLVWANGFGVWHCKATFKVALGNTPEAEQIAAKAVDRARREIRKALNERGLIGKGFRNSYQVKENETEPGTGRLMSLTIAEKVNA